VAGEADQTERKVSQAEHNIYRPQLTPSASALGG